MNYGQLKDFTLQLINRYSMAGGKIAESYNNQQDYINRIPALVNDALIYISSSYRRIPAQRLIVPEEGEDYGEYLRFMLPEDCLTVRPGGMLRPLGRDSRSFVSYMLQEPDMLLVSKQLTEPVVLEYYRRPQLLEEKPADAQGLDAGPEVLMATAYYAAAHLVIQDDAFIYAALYKEFENKLARLIVQPQSEPRPTPDCYGMDTWGDVYG